MTIEEFRDFCNITGYLESKGRKKDEISIDRINPSKGYELMNIRIVTNSINNRYRFLSDAERRAIKHMEDMGH